MSVFFGWLILGFLAALVSFVPPYFDPDRRDGGSYWQSCGKFNLFLWGLLIGAGSISGLLIFGLHLIGVM